MKQKPAKQARKPRYVGYVAASIDGKISLTENAQPDWTSKEDWAFFQKELGKADAVVVGRNTFLTVENRLRKRNTFLLTSRVRKTGADGTVTLVNPKGADLAKILSPYKTVAVVGGASVYQTMLDMNLLNELYVTIEPLVFGRGKEMFSGGAHTRLFTLVSVKKLNTKGTLLLRYRIKKR